MQILYTKCQVIYYLYSHIFWTQRHFGLKFYTDIVRKLRVFFIPNSQFWWEITKVIWKCNFKVTHENMEPSIPFHVDLRHANFSTISRLGIVLLDVRLSWDVLYIVWYRLLYQSMTLMTNRNYWDHWHSLGSNALLDVAIQY